MDELQSQTYDLVVEACGAGRVVEAGLPLLRPGGVMVLVGCVTPDTLFSAPAELLVRRCATLVGVHNYQHSDLRLAAEYIARTEEVYDYGQLISPPLPLEKFAEAVELALTNTFHRVLIKP